VLLVVGVRGRGSGGYGEAKGDVYVSSRRLCGVHASGDCGDREHKKEEEEVRDTEAAQARRGVWTCGAELQAGCTTASQLQN
jgi:hypothetical protein